MTVQLLQIHYANQLGERPWFDYPLELNLRTCSFADILLAKTDTSLTSSNILLLDPKGQAWKHFETMFCLVKGYLPKKSVLFERLYGLAVHAVLLSKKGIIGKQLNKS